MTDFNLSDSEWLDRYLADELTSAERAELARWLDASATPAAARRILTRLDRAVHLTAVSLDPATIDAFLDRVREARIRDTRMRDMHVAAHTATDGGARLPRTHVRLMPKPGRSSGGAHGGLQRPGMRSGLRITMATVAFIGAIAAGLVATQRGAFLRSFQSAMPVAVYTTVARQQTTITLPDGSRAWLAPQSRLRVPSGFGTSTRTVELDGEAYFDVAHVRGAPFIVKAGRVTTRVLGTSFDVRHYAGEAAVRVAVVSGAVMTVTSHTSATLTAGVVAHVTDSTVAADTVRDVSAYADWTRGRLVFKRTSVTAMLATVGRWYGYEFRLADTTLASDVISATFDIGTSRETLTAIRELLDVTMSFDGAVVTLRPRQGAARSAPPRHTPGSFSTPTEVGR